MRFPLRSILRGLLAVMATITMAGYARAADTATIGSVTAAGSTVQVPIYIVDSSGTPLGSDAGAGKHIAGLTFQVVYSPASAVSSVTLTRSGITQNQTPIFESNPAPPGPGIINYIGAFGDTQIPFTLNAGAPGNEVARLTFNLSASAAPGSTITLSFDPNNTSLSNQGGDVSESSGAGLTLVDGSITIPALTLGLGPGGQQIVNGSSADFMATISAPIGTSALVTLSSSNPSVVQVPASVTIQPGTTYYFFTANGLSVGSATIHASLPAALGGAQASLDTSVYQESPPTAPTWPMPADGATSVPMPVILRWASDSSYQYHVFFGTASGPPPYTSTNGTSVSVSTVAGTTYYWRVESSNSSGTVSSPEWSFTTLQTNQCKTPVAPTLTLPDSAQSGQAYQLTWTAAADATEYQVDESTSTGFSSVQTTTVTAPKTTLSVTKSVSADTMLYYRVRGRNGGTCNLVGPNSASRGIVIRSPAPAPRVIPVVGSLQGNGAVFKTAVQLLNPSAGTISGKIVFHKAGASGSDADPSLAYSLAPNQAVSYTDVLPAFGQSGIGSADLIITSGAAPLSVIRIFATGNFNGSTGMTQDTVSGDDALKQGETGILIAPPDVTNFRFNIGVRTLVAGANMTITIRNKDGIVTGSLTKSFSPSFFSQTESSAFLGVPLNPTDSIYFTITGGSAIIYGATTDNASQDPALQIARRPM